VPGGLSPDLSVDYSSGGTDGGVANTNNQASWVGEGFELASSFIERKYSNCYDDRAGASNKSSLALDLCWYSNPSRTDNQPWDNAFLSMAGHGGQLVRVGNTASWRLEKDDGTRVAKIGDATANNEYWRVTTPDGTQYFYGKSLVDNSAAPKTNSVWSVPVAANNSGEPGYKSTFASSFKPRPWRWNLDYVVSPTGRTIVYAYVKESNKYKQNLATSTSYDRGGYLSTVSYGESQGAETTDSAPAKVTFTVEERCDTAVSSACKTSEPSATTAAAWPDVPLDAYCQAYCPSAKTAPTFFTRKRLKQIDTYTRNSVGTGWDATDTWVLGGSFPSTNNSAATPSLWLSAITRTAQAGTPITLPAVSLTPIMLESRITGGSGTPLRKPRLAAITTETGELTLVEYSLPACTASTVPSSTALGSNTTRCMPVYYGEGTATPTLQWFNKYVVTSVTQRDPVAVADANLTGLGLDISADEVTTYTYAGGSAWHFDDTLLASKKYATWNDWRGYGKITTVTGGGSVKGVTEDTYFRGMNLDKLDASGAVKSATVTDSSGTTLTDDDWLAGMVRETRTLRAVGGAVDSGYITDRRVAVVTSDGWRTSRQVAVSRTTYRETLGSGATRTGVSSALAWDAYGQPTLEEDQGDTAVSGDETCTRTSYAAPSSSDTGVVDLVAESSTMPSLCSVTLSYGSVIDASRHFYGSTTLGAISNAGLETRVDSLIGSGANRNWTTTRQTTYDGWGRAATKTDAMGNTGSVQYSHTTGGRLASTVDTSPDPDGTGPLTAHLVTTTLDPRRGAATKIVAAGGQTTEYSVDALGRPLAVWNPGRSKATQSASVTYSYTISQSVPSSVTTKTLLPNGTNYSTSIALLDSRLRTRQVQNTGAVSGRLITDTRYDSRGNAVLVDSYYNSSAPGAALVQPTTRASIPNSYRWSYDYAGRATKSAFYSGEVFQWQTTAIYEADRTKVSPPAGGTPSTVIYDLQRRLTRLIKHLGTTTDAPGATTSYAYDTAGNLSVMTDAKGNQWRYTYDLDGNRITVRDPDRGASSYAYDPNDHMVSSTDGRGVTLKYFYDNLGRPTKTTKVDGTTALTTSAYDTVKKGLLASSSRSVSGGTITSKVDSYDSAGRPTGSSLVVPQIAGVVPAELAGTYTSTITYNPDGSINTQTVPKLGDVPGETLTRSYTSNGLPATLTGTLGTSTATYVTDTQYLQWGTVSAMILGTADGKAVMTSYARDPATLRLTGMQLNREVSPGVTDEQTSITYDPSGNITQVKATLAGGQTDNQCFSYDHLGQLTQAWTPNAPGCDADSRSQSNLSGPAPYWSSWTLNEIGETTSRTDRTPTASSTTSYSRAADGANSVTPHFITGASTTGSTVRSGTYSADAAGNTLTRTGADGELQDLVWDDLNQLTEIREGGSTIARMVYDANGNRVVRQSGNDTTLFIGDAELTLTQSSSRPPLQSAGPSTLAAARYYTNAGMTIAVRTGAGNNTVVTLVPDWQGTTHHQVNNATGELTTIWQDPYGKGRGIAPAVWAGDLGFVGGTRDAVGLTLVGARYYDPALGQFISADPLIDLTDPVQWNAYGYAGNSPITKSDPTGLMDNGGGGGPYSPPIAPWPPPPNPPPGDGDNGGKGGGKGGGRGGGKGDGRHKSRCDKACEKEKAEKRARAKARAKAKRTWRRDYREIYKAVVPASGIPVPVDKAGNWIPDIGWGFFNPFGGDLINHPELKPSQFGVCISGSVGIVGQGNQQICLGKSADGFIYVSRTTGAGVLSGAGAEVTVGVQVGNQGLSDMRGTSLDGGVSLGETVVVTEQLSCADSGEPLCSHFSVTYGGGIGVNIGPALPGSINLGRSRTDIPFAWKF
jgi:RHS repeat-associated protein